MSGDREEILKRVGDALAALPERTPYPEYDTDLAVTYTKQMDDPWERFKSMLSAVNGRAFESVTDLGRWLLESGYIHGCCDPDLIDQLGSAFPEGLTMETEFDRTRIDDYAFGITRARAAIAESGTLVIDDATTWQRLAALAPWVHIAVLRRSDLWCDIPTAVENLGDDPNVIWITGPSKTADVEGILIEGVHGPGEQVCLLVDG
jgi:L-lactate dehydrogenase complex protein LldG